MRRLAKKKNMESKKSLKSVKKKKSGEAAVLKFRNVRRRRIDAVFGEFQIGWDWLRRRLAVSIFLKKKFHKNTHTHTHTHTHTQAHTHTASFRSAGTGSAAGLL